jgi:hypothetical protein
MNKEFCPYEIALALKELGFDEECIASYNNEGDFKDPFEYNSEETDGYVTNSSLKNPKNFNASSNLALLKDYIDNPFTAAPLKQQAFKWFREKYNLWGMIYPRDGWNYSIQRVDETTSCTGESFHGVEIKSYEEAELDCIKKLIDITKNK